ncbi:hypothetical protein B2G71_05920 [Novosphingobium sp. PC22D]|uniref:hypothetical protein n=1 Tax=Novosphingobium sp. PC22D TaxID=1962403 RepID=UPI000BF0061A|nr:hypothetical protein [Novosphingobium sp. PC22D]PEQ13842.1 hypothetical protein B2G71_05920 [Novosphingobium sp. PC22D]
MTRGGRRSGRLGATFAMPAAICVAGVIGLVSALTGDGWRDALAWVGLAVPVIATAWAMATRRK